MAYHSDKVHLSETFRITAGIKSLAVIAKEGKDDTDFIISIGDDETTNAIYLDVEEASRLVGYMNAHIIMEKG